MRRALLCAWLACTVASVSAQAQTCPDTRDPTAAPHECDGVAIAFDSITADADGWTAVDVIWVVDQHLYTAETVRIDCAGTCVFSGVRDADQNAVDGVNASPVHGRTPPPQAGVAAAALGYRAHAGPDIGVAGLVPMTPQRAVGMQAHAGLWGASATLDLRDRDRSRVRLDVASLDGTPQALLIAHDRVRLSHALAWVTDGDIAFAPRGTPTTGANALNASRAPWVGSNTRTGDRDEFATAGFSLATDQVSGALLYRRERGAETLDGVDVDVSVNQSAGRVSARADAASTVATDHDALLTALGARMEWSAQAHWRALSVTPRLDVRGVGAARHGTTTSDAIAGDYVGATVGLTPEVQLLRSRRARLQVAADGSWATGFEARDHALVSRFFNAADFGPAIAGRASLQVFGPVLWRANYTVEQAEDAPLAHRLDIQATSQSGAAFLQLDGDLRGDALTRLHAGVSVNVGDSTLALRASHADSHGRTARFGALPLRSSDDAGGNGTSVYTDWRFVWGRVQLMTELAYATDTGRDDAPVQSGRLGGTATAGVTLGRVALFASGGKLIFASEGFAFLGIRTSAAPAIAWLAGR